MRSNKLIDLVNALTTAEKNKIKTLFKIDGGTKKYEALFDILVSANNANLDKESIYSQLYNTPYTKEKDYLLRNTYRNLTKKIEDFLIDEAFHKEIHKNLNIHNFFLLKSFQHLRLYHIFDTSFKESLNQALADGDYLLASSITSLQVNNYTHHIIPETKKLEQANDLLMLQMAYLSAFYLKKQSQAELKQKEIQNTTSITATTKTSNRYVDENEKKYSNYLQLKYKLFDGQPTETVSILKQCISLLKALPINYDNVSTEMQFCEIALAHEYTVNEKFDDANVLYRTLLGDINNVDVTLKTTLVFDYISNLIRQEKYDEALEKALHYEKDLKNNTPALNLKIRFLKLMLYAFLKKDHLLHAEIPLCNGLADYEKYTSRFLHSIVAYLRGDVANAYRECLNLKNSLRYKGPRFDVRDILNFYLRFYYLLKSNPDKDGNLKKGLERLWTDMQHYTSNALPEFKEYLPFLWLKRELKSKL